MSKQQQVQTHHGSRVQSTFRQLKECSCRNLRMVTGVLVIAVAVGEMQAAITTYDFNDGTVQGWGAGAGSVANENNQLRFTNENKSVAVQLMQFNPTPDNWSGAREITFDLEFTSYDGISAPSELTNHYAAFRISRSDGIMGGDYGTLSWNLDVAGWDFNEKRSFTLNIADANFTPYGNDPSRDGILQDVYAMSFTFETNSDTANASGLFDNFSVVPEPSTLLLGMLGLAGCALVRRRSRSIS